MDRIDGNFRNIPLQPKPQTDEKKGKKTGAPGKTSFLGFLKTEEHRREASALSSAPGELTEAQIESLLDEVYESGQDLVQFPSPENVQRYKKKIGQFLQSVVKGALELTEVEGRLRTKDMKRPKYALIQVINEKLDKLGAYVLQNQREKLELLGKVDELHGLLVDLKH